MRTAHILYRRNKHNSLQQALAAFGEGLARHGFRVTGSEDFLPADLMVTWGIRRQEDIDLQRASGGEICILERGYVGNRLHTWHSVSFGGGLNGRGRYYGPLHDPSRWEQHFSGVMRPWRPRRGGQIIIIGQVPTDTAVRDIDINAWARDAQQHFEVKGCRVYFRPHPAICPDQCPLSTALDQARLVVTYNSNSAVDAVLAGIPAIAMDQGSMAWDVTSHDLDADPVIIRRNAWAHALAWKQWTLDEMRSGECWDVAQPR